MTLSLARSVAAIRVLLVDDNPSDRALAHRALMQEFPEAVIIEVSSAQHLTEALAGERFDLVITDYQLGWGDGLEVLRAAKERSGECPVIMFTSSGSEEVAVEAMKAGLDDYVIKSNRNLVRLRVAAGAALDRAASRREARYLQVQLREAEERFRLLVEGVNEYALFMTDAAGNVSSWNPGGERILGYTEEEILGKNLDIFFIPEERAEGRPARELQEAVQNGRASDDGWHVRKDGTRLYVHGVLTALRDEAGNLRGFTKVMRDMTKAHEAEQHLKREYQKERHIAETLQRSLLLAPLPDAYPGITVKPLYEPAYEDALIGGDWFDIYSIGDSQIALVVGDCTGKGIDSATYTAELKFGLRAFLREHPSPAEALERLNRHIAQADRYDRKHLGTAYVAVALAVVDTVTGEVTCTSAGIDPPFVLRTETAEAQPLSSGGGPMLGVEALGAYSEERTHLQGGDLLVMSTDGITEARRGSGSAREFFGYEGLIQAVRECRRHESLAVIAQSVAERAREFAGGRRQDDVCLLIARRR